MGGRSKGTPNRKTIEAVVEATVGRAELRKMGQRKATEVLNELMHTAMGFAARYQRGIMVDPNPDDDAAVAKYKQETELFWLAMEKAGQFAKALAPYQDPQFRAIQIMPSPSMGPPPLPEPKTVEGKVIRMDDPMVVAKMYQQLVKKRIAV